MSTHGMTRGSRLPLGAGVAMVLAACTFAYASTARGYESGTRPLPGRFQGTFQGKGFGTIYLEVVPESRYSPRVGIRDLSGSLPGVCVRDGKTRIAGRDGVFGIDFNLADRLKRRPRTEIPADGAFAFTFEHRADVLKGTSYSVSIRGTFGRKTVSGRMQGTAADSFLGKCRGNRTFTARLVRG